MKVVIPVAGTGSRFRPHTFSRPKAMMKVAGKELISFIIDRVKTLDPDEVVFVLGAFKKTMRKFLENYLKDQELVFVEQDILNGDAWAIKIALDALKKMGERDDEVFIIFNDTIIDFNIKQAISKNSGFDGIVFCKKVEDPKHYGVVYVDSEGLIYDVVEKPEVPGSDLAIIGAYWFRSWHKLLEVTEIVLNGPPGKGGEYRLADVIKLMVNKEDDRLDEHEKCQIRTVAVEKWFDCGRPDILLKSNEYLLSKMSRGSDVIKLRGDSVIIGPAFVARGAKIERSVIGPNVSVSTGVVIKNSVITDSIIDDGAVLENIVVKDSVIGPKVVLRGQIRKFNVGENSVVDF